MLRFRFMIICSVLLLIGGAAVAQDSSPGVVNVYSARHYGAMEGTFTAFTEQTGIVVRLSQGSPQSLLERLRAEGAQTPADVFFSIDAGALALAADEGLLQAVESAVLTEAIPDDLRDPDDRWFAFSQRFRTIMYNPAVVDPSELSTYEQLADPVWQERLCLRPATHIYTISLVGSLIAALGEADAETVVAGWVANNPQYIDSDTEILNTVAAGGCDVALTNHYYLARLLGETPDFPVALFWANQGEGDRGTFRNISGAGVTANALNRDNAVALLEWLATTGQAADDLGVPGGNNEYPVNAEAPIKPILETFGAFTIDALPLTEYGALQIQAIDLLERAGYGF
ncbi:MAG: extracellular solute-binding protein [Chloroflexota bacterium]|nr:extracellular solute-binding protein [Chloroflexota bacterium]